jgi:hypothetical protein
MKTLTQCKIKTSLFLAFAVASTHGGLVLAQEATTEATTTWMSSTGSPTTRMSYHDNAVKMVMKNSGYSILGGTYTTSDQSISGGQDPNHKNNPPQTYDVSGDGKISFSVGRNGSEAVANWFASRAGGNLNTFGKNPGKLNFAFQGDLTLSIQGAGLSPDQPVVFKDIFLAQGHSGSTNNWWFGGFNCMKTAGNSTNEVVCKSANYPAMKFTFTRGDYTPLNRTPVDQVYVYISQSN